MLALGKQGSKQIHKQEAANRKSQREQQNTLMQQAFSEGLLSCSLRDKGSATQTPSREALPGRGNDQDGGLKEEGGLPVPGAAGRPTRV